jgi:hypothetical protein
MQDVENNIDDLLRRAAAAYPLKDGGDEWDRIAPRLMPSSISNTQQPARGRSAQACIPVLLFFVLFLLVTGIATGDADGMHKLSANPATAKAVINNAAPSASTKTKQYFQQVQEETNPVSSSQTPVSDSRRIGQAGPTNAQNGPIGNTSLLRRYPVTDGQHLLLLAKPATGLQAPVAGNGVDAYVQTMQQAFQDTVSSRINALPALVSLRPAGVGTALSPASPATAHKSSRFYAGILFGPSFNQVKSQGLRKPGVDIGLLGGYQLTRRVSIETGVFYGKKYYFSDGKYFDMAKAGSTMPAGMNISSLEGSCSVIEIPFKIKYNLLVAPGKNLYTTAGISGYIVTSEYNKYHVLFNGAAQDITGSYKKPSGYTAAALVLGAGYGTRVGKSLTLQIAPYVQIPLRGIGIGSLPVMTTGIHIGFTRLF